MSSAGSIRVTRSWPEFFICHSGHEHDQIYSENLVAYLIRQGIACHEIQFNRDGYREELLKCLDHENAVILGYNSQLDHSYIAEGGFVAAASRRKIPVIQWILDHPASRWAEFNSTRPWDSCFLVNSKHEESYFQRYCSPGTVTGVMGGVGPNVRSRINELSGVSFLERPISCLIPLSFRRIRSFNEALEKLGLLDSTMLKVTNEAISIARFELTKPLETHLIHCLKEHNLAVPNQIFNLCFQLLEEFVQMIRRIYIFKIVRNYPVIVQSDETAAAYVQGSSAGFSTETSMPGTLRRMPRCRSILSVSPMNDMIHDRTMNAVNAGCVPIIEDNLAHRQIFKHRYNALIFRYGDDSLKECLDVVCNKPELASDIAKNAFTLRDDPRCGFGQFQNCLDVALRQVEELEAEL
jgi:hypothetical protein